MTPLVLDTVIRLKRNPIPCLLAIAMASTQAGNFTRVGPRQSARRPARAGAGIAVGFWAYFKVGAPLTLLTMLFGIYWRWH